MYAVYTLQSVFSFSILPLLKPRSLNKRLASCRFDARLLLSSLPPSDAQEASSSTDPATQIGWDDLPSDSEDTFFMSVAEIDTYLVDKRQRDMEINRQKRMRAFEEREAAERDPNDPAGWGGSDEEVLTVAHFTSYFMNSNIAPHISA